MMLFIALLTHDWIIDERLSVNVAGMGSIVNLFGPQRKYDFKKKTNLNVMDIKSACPRSPA